MPQEHEPFDTELSALEDALGSVVPARSRMDRDRVMFLAGRASARPSPSGRGAWVAIAASLAFVALGEGALLARRPAPQVIERVVLVPAPAPAHDESPPGRVEVSVRPEQRLSGDDFGLGQTTRERLAAQVLRYGLDGLPAPPSATRSGSESWSASSHQLLQEEVDKILHPGDPS